MIKSFTAATREIDDAKAAVAEILNGLDMENRILKNSVGIVSCFSEFEDTGVLEAICAALPFPCVGTTTCLCSTSGETDEIIFGVVVLTSDDCVFEPALIPVNPDNYEITSTECVREFLSVRPDKPALILSYFPLINEISGDMLISAMDKATGGVPLFGSCAVDHTNDRTMAKTIFNGKAFRSSMSICAIYGNPHMDFTVISVVDKKIHFQKAIITGSEGNILTGVNGKSALEYLEDLGLTKEAISGGLNVIPFMIDQRDGSGPIARAVFALTPEGNAVCGGLMPEGATLSVNRLTSEEIISESEAAFIKMAGKEGTILCYSCFGRYVILGANSLDEAEAIRKAASDADYMYTTAGGEICPLYDKDGGLHNFFHNFSNIYCRLS